MEQPVDVVVKKPKGSRTVILLKNDDYRRRNGQVYIPNTIEMAQIKKPIRGQYKKNVQFSKNMDEDMVKHQLQEAFPTFDLKNGRFSCAAVIKDSITFQFHGTPRVWDGKTIKRLITGNSVLYIVMEGDQVSQQLQLNTATESCGSSTDTCVNLGYNTTDQTTKEINPMNVHVPLDGQLTPYHETAENIAQTPCVTETEMEVDDSKQGNDDELHVDMWDIPASSVNQVIHDSTWDDNLLSYFDSLDFTSCSESGVQLSSEDNCSPSQWIPELKVESVTPKQVPLQGGDLCCFRFSQPLPSNVQSGIAVFEALGYVDVNKCGDYSLVGMKIPSAQEPGWVTVILKSEFGILLGEINILYVDEEKVLVQRVVNEPRLQNKLLRELERKAKTASEGETQDSGNLDFTNPVQVLCLLIYAAAESGAQQFIEMIFNSSAGRIVFDGYKDRLLLPEVIAKSHGNEETAHYLQDVTKRFSEETTTGKECSQTINWSELVNAAEAAEKRLDVTSEKDVQIQKDILKETGYLGDIDTSSSESSEAQSSDSDDDISRTSRKEIQMDAEECKQPVWQLEDHAIEARKANLTQSPILFLKDGVITYIKIKTLKWKEIGLHLIQASPFQDAYNVREVKYLQGSGISFLLGLGNEPVHNHLITTYQRLGYLLALSKEQNAYDKMHVDTAEDHQSLEHLSTTTVGNVDDYKASRLDALQQLCCRLINGEFTTTTNREDLTVRGKSAECLMEHCRSAAPDFWVLTYIFLPTRKTLFVYVADSKDVFPLASCFDDRQYELSWECQQWQGCKNNVPKVQEIYKFPESKSVKKGEIWLQGDLHRRDSKRDSEDLTAGNYQGLKEILPQFVLIIHRKDRNGESEDSIAGNYRGHKETLHQFESISGKKWQQGNLHRKDPNRLSGNPIASNYLDCKETSHPFAIVLSCALFIVVGVGYMMEWFPILTDTNKEWLLVITGMTIGLFLTMLLVMIILLDFQMKNYKMERKAEDYESKSKSGKKGETWQQGDLHRKDPNRLTGNPIAGNYLDHKETLHQFESRNSKKGEIWQQGDLHHRQRNRDTGDPKHVKYLDHTETLHLLVFGIVFSCVLFIGVGYVMGWLPIPIDTIGILRISLLYAREKTAKMFLAIMPLPTMPLVIVLLVIVLLVRVISFRECPCLTE